MAETEVVKRVLRIKAAGAPPRAPAPNRWQAGTGPIVRVSGQSSVDSGQSSVDRTPVAPSVARLAPAPAPVQVEEQRVKSDDERRRPEPVEGLKSEETADS
ncbi:MAG: hypothetical protein M5U34_12625 [Chloroflexi bacterium]|nr:hypothetical protein [Chloroflexota bacterium]